MVKKFVISRYNFCVLLFLNILLTIPFPTLSTENFIVLASTTSTVNSGLLSNILPVFTNETGISVRVVGVGTGQAIKLAERGDADVLLVHHKPSEVKFINEGFGVKRFDVMYNDFVIIGPKGDPAQIQDLNSVTEAYKNIANSRSIFVSRGDQSGTHKKSLEIWRAALVNIESLSTIWYREVGAGMGATLNIAKSMKGYTLSDRSTWAAFKNKGLLKILFDRDLSLKNQYGVIMVNPQLHRHVKEILANTFIKWMVSRKGQELIDNFKVNGKRTFFANAKN